MVKILLKFGTIKGWENLNDKQREALQKWADIENGLGTMQAGRKPEANTALCDAFDLFEDGEFLNDWSGDLYTVEEAKNYILNYGAQKW